MKKISVYLTLLSLLIGMMSTGVYAEDAAAKAPILNYDFEALDGNKVYNTVDSSKYYMGVAASPVLESVSETEVNYPEKYYVKTTDAGYTSNAAHLDSDITSKLNNGISVNTWFKTGPDTSKDFCPFTIMSGSPNNSAKPYIMAMMDHYGTLRIRVLCNNSSTDSLQMETFEYSRVGYKANTWYNLCVSYNHSTNEAPIVYWNGEQKKMSSTTWSEELTPVSIPQSSDEDVTLRLARGTERNGVYWYDMPKIGYAAFSLYDEAFAASDLLEQYNESKGWFEPQYNISVYDGFGAFVSQKNLGSVYKADGYIPQIKIDMDTVSGTDNSTFTPSNVKIYDVNNDKYIEYVPEITGNTYKISLDLLAAGNYKLEINNIQDTDGNYIRESAQTLAFGIKSEEAPTLIANYDMKSKFNTLDNDKYNLTGFYDASFKKINDYAYTDTYRIYSDNNDLAQGGNGSTRMVIPDIAYKLNGSFTIDTWFYSVGSGDQYLFTIVDNGTSAQKTYREVNFNSEHCRFGDLFRKTNEDGTLSDKRVLYENQTAKIKNRSWNHIVFEYVPGSETQKIYINGTAYELTTDAGAIEEGYSPVNIPEQSMFRLNSTINRNSYTENGCTWYPTYGGGSSRFRFSNIAIYTGVSDSVANYISSKGIENYEASYDLTLYQNDEAVTLEGLDAVQPGALMAKIKNVTADAINGKIKITDGAGNEIQGVIAEADEGVTVSFDSIAEGSYKLVLDKSVNDRTTDYTLDFVCKKAQTAVNLTQTDTGVKAEAVVADKDSAVLILAVYADGALKSIQTSTTITNGKMETAEIAVAGGETAKAMLWDGFANLAPIVPAV